MGMASALLRGGYGEVTRRRSKGWNGRRSIVQKGRGRNSQNNNGRENLSGS